MLAEVRVLASEQELLLDTERVGLQALFDALRQFRVGYRAELHKRTLECSLLSLIGPGADARPWRTRRRRPSTRILRRPSPGCPCERSGPTSASTCSAQASWGRRSSRRSAAPGPSRSTTRPPRRFASSAGVPASASRSTRTRCPRRPASTSAPSLQKGCYVGQETVARLYWKGKPNRLLRGLRLSGPRRRGRAAAARRASGRARRVDRDSPRLGPIGLALLRREAEPGAVLEVGDGHGQATVVELPFAGG